MVGRTLSVVVWALFSTVAVAMSVVACEVLARRMIRKLRAGFQWLITEQDAAPDLDQEGLSKFIPNGYDPELGWMRKPNTSGTEPGGHGTVSWTIDETGGRKDPYMEGYPVRVIAVGDSYTFGRQVADEDAWPALLGRSLGVRVLNLGVGNYGLDQCILRYQREAPMPGVDAVILGVVPETMARIHSSWKHYSEYGNTFAFKPRFRLNDDKLELLPNVIDIPQKFERYRDYLSVLQIQDYFYSSKFRHDMIRSPYVWHWLTKPRNRVLVALLRERERRRTNGTCDRSCEDAPFRSVMGRNVRLAGQMYGKGECCALFKALVHLFAEDVRAAGAEPVFVMFPQLLDLKCFGDRQPYRPMFDELGEHLLVVDAAEALAGSDRHTLYAQDIYGGHYSIEGNVIIAGLMKRYVDTFVQRAGHT